ncbi:MAG: RsmE family RNA methyltransferase [Actinomycetota bacterium]
MTSRRHAAAHVFVRDLALPVLEDQDAHHLLRVLRIRPGETVTVSNGSGAWRTCVMSSRSDLEVVDDTLHSEPFPAHPITVVFGVTKNDKPETVVQKLTELGVDHIVPVLLDLSVVRWEDDKIERQHERFVKVSREAAMQSRQIFLPSVHRVVSGLETLLESSVMKGQWGRVALADPDGSGDVAAVSALIIGSEGGFSQRELDLVDARVSLVGGVLRAETAGIAAGVLLAHARTRS